MILKIWHIWKSSFIRLLKVLNSCHMKTDGTVKQNKAGTKKTCTSSIIFSYAWEKKLPKKGQSEIIRYQDVEEWQGRGEKRREGNKV